MRGLLFSVFSATVYSGVLSQSTVTPASFAATEFDVVIVGGGTAGLVLANRLSATSLNVGLIDAGHYNESGDDTIDIPTGFLTTDLLSNDDYVWPLASVPQSRLNDRSISYPRGKVLGGSSAINGLIWQRASVAEYDAWGNTFGNGDDWTWENMLPYFERMETWNAPTTTYVADDTYSTSLPSVEGESGPLDISYNTFFTPLDIDTAESTATLGFLLNPNTDGGNSTFLPIESDARCADPTTGKRSYAVAYYNETVRARSNLVVLQDTIASRIIWDNSTLNSSAIKATGVEYVGTDGVTYVVNVSKEVILSAGSVKSPQILELSGVGNSTILEGLGIDVVLDFPQIGENLFDHASVYTDYLVNDGIVTLDQLNWNSTYLAEQTELFNTNGTGALSWTVEADGSFPLKQIVASSNFTAYRSELDSELANKTLTPLQSAQYDLLKTWADAGNIGWLAIRAIPSGGIVSTRESGSSYYTLGMSLYHAFSRGSVHINSTVPSASAVIDPNFLEFEWDRNALLSGLVFTRQMAAASPLVDLLKGANSPDASVQAAEDFNDFLEARLSTTNHPAGTTVMASQDVGGVVSPRLKVYGLDNVRVVDAGVFPITTSSALQQTVYVIAEKASDMIIEDLSA